MKIIKFFIAVFGFCIFQLSCYAVEITSEEIKNQGIASAKEASSKIHEAYLKCYALTPGEKLKCSQDIVHQKLQYDKSSPHYKQYVTSFGYEAEKLGFVLFLNKHSLSCDTVEGGPIYSKKTKAYDVTCKNKQTYQLVFDYKTKEWSVNKK